MKRWLIVTWALVALAVAGLGAWVAFGRGGGSPRGPPASASPPSGASVTGTPSVSSASPTAIGQPGPAVGIGEPLAATHTDPAAERRRPLRRPSDPAMVRGPRNLSVPILMYHLIGNPPAGEPYPDLFVSRPDFVVQMRYLEAHGYTAVTLTQVDAFWHGNGRLPAKPVVLTFDDGYRSDWVVAAPILQRIGWPGVLDLCMTPWAPTATCPWRSSTGSCAPGGRSTTTPSRTPTLPRSTPPACIARSSSLAVLQALTGQKVSFFCYPRAPTTPA